MDELVMRIGFSNNEILPVLAHKLSVVVSVRILKRACLKQRLFRRMDTSVLAGIAANGQLKGIHGYSCVQIREEV